MGFEAEYLTRFQERQTLLFKDYARGDSVDLGSVEASMYGLCSEYHHHVSGSRRDRVLASVATRGRVDWHPIVSDLRNRLDSPHLYAVANGASHAAIAAAMEDDLVELIGVRNRLANDEGFPSYAHLAMWAEGLDLSGVRNLAVLEGDAAFSGARRTVDQQHMTLGSWFDDLERIGGPGPDDIPMAASTLASLLGLDHLAEPISWIVRDQPIFGVAFALSVPDDVRVLVGRSGSLTASVTAYHELGHALAHASNQANGVFRTWETTTDESMAVVMEAVALRLVLQEDQRARLVTVERLETARLATSLLFEFDVNDRPGKARELFADWYEPLVPVDDPVVWARDTFRSIDPFHIQGYLIGNIVAGATVAFLAERFPGNPRAWGAWLVENYYAPGRGASLSTRLESLEDHRPQALTGVLRE